MSRIAIILSAAVFLVASAGLALQPGKGGTPLPVEVDARGLRELIARDSGSVVMVNAWASWCKPCKAEMPDLVALYRAYEKRGLRLILISADEPELLKSDVLNALEKAGVRFQTYLKSDSTDDAFINGLSPEWGGALPATFLYDRSNRQVRTLVGARTKLQFEEAILPLLGKGP